MWRSGGGERRRGGVGAERSRGGWGGEEGRGGEKERRRRRGC